MTENGSSSQPLYVDASKAWDKPAETKAFPTAKPEKIVAKKKQPAKKTVANKAVGKRVKK